MDEAQLRQYQNMAHGIATGDFFKPVEGVNNLRLLPAPPGSPPDTPCLKQRRVHFRVGPKSRASLCNKPLGAKCAICENIEAQAAAGTPQEQLKNLLPSSQWESCIVNLLGLDPNANEYQAQFWDATDAQAKQTLDYLCDPQYGDVTDPTTGRNCKIVKTARGSSFDYKISFSPDTSAFDVSKVKYPTVRQPHSYEDQKKLLQGIDLTTADSPSSASTSPAPVATPQTPIAGAGLPPVQQAAIPAPLPAPMPATSVPTPPPAPMPVAAPPVPATPIAAPPPVVPPEQMYWIGQPDGKAKEGTAADIKAAIAAGQDPQVMDKEQTKPWAPASQWNL